MFRTKVLLVNNHDSFVYNIYQILLDIKVDVDVKLNDDHDIQNVEKYDRIIISPGPGNPVNDKDAGYLYEMMDSIKSGTKVLGICFGHQFLAHYLGSEIVLSKHLMHGQVDRVRHLKSPIYKDVPESFDVIRYHSLAIKPNKNITIDCVSEKDETVMGFHSNDGSIFGIQFHPESYYSQFGETIFKNFTSGAL